ncbi:MAG: hypothetical protein PHV24_06115 [Candidatus Kapabacteria bacterium]|nr:hypothetical protein [Candidatus Kapabacteria bacterium]
MKASKILTWIFVVTFATLQWNVAYAKPNHHKGQKAMQKLNQIKKMKMLEILELDNTVADKFLIKYNEWDKKIDEHRKKTDIARKELDLAISKGEDKTSLAQKTDAFTEILNEMPTIIKGRNNDIRAMLDAENYAKFILFEDRFMFDVQKHMFKATRSKKGKIMPPPPSFDEDDDK